MFYYFDVVFDGLFANCFINVLHEAKLETQFLIGLILKSV